MYAWKESVIAAVRTPDGIAELDCRRHHCGNCEHRRPESSAYPDYDRDHYCGIFLVELKPERDIDGRVLEWRRCAECLAGQIKTE